MAEIGLVEAIERVREELADAIANGEGADVWFPVDQVTLEFKVGLTKTDGGSGKVKLYVLELGAEREYARETVAPVSSS